MVKPVVKPAMHRTVKLDVLLTNYWSGSTRTGFLPKCHPPGQSCVAYQCCARLVQSTVTRTLLLPLAPAQLDTSSVLRGIPASCSIHPNITSYKKGNCPRLHYLKPWTCFGLAQMNGAPLRNLGRVGPTRPPPSAGGASLGRRCAQRWRRWSPQPAPPPR